MTTKKSWTTQGHEHVRLFIYFLLLLLLKYINYYLYGIHGFIIPRIVNIEPPQNVPGYNVYFNESRTASNCREYG